MVSGKDFGKGHTDLSEPSWWDDLQDVAGSDIQKGHILGSQLGGKEKGARNLTPLYQRPNTPAMKTCEGFLRQLVETCKYCVELTITVDGYGTNMNAPVKARPVMPKSITIKWVVDGTIRGTFVIENDPKITTQEPCRVKNLPCR